MLQAGLSKNFGTASVEVVECPDLKEWGLAAGFITIQIYLMQNFSFLSQYIRLMIISVV